MRHTPRHLSSPTRRFRPASLAFGFALLLLALPATAQPETPDPALDAPVRFLIETITVEGVERPATREIVEQESGVAPGTEVDEDQLRQAIYRIRRLPFVIDADFSLQKGSERGRFELVILIESASSFFADLSAGAAWNSGEISDQNGDLDWFGAVGARRFVGARGYAFGSIDRFRNLQVGYTQFHIFGSGSYLTAGVGTNLEDDSAGYTLSLSAGKPLTAEQALRFEARYSGGFDAGSGQSASLEWLYNTTDDPLLPTRGETLSASAGYGASDFEFRFLDDTFFRSESLGWSVGTVARHYWPLASHHSIWGELAVSHRESRSESSGGFNRTVSRSSNESGSAGLGYAWDLIRSQVGEPRNDLRFSARASYATVTNAAENGFVPRVLTLETGLIFRRPQGSISLTFSYIDDYDRQRFFP